MCKWEIKEKLLEYGFNEAELLDMFLYWLDVNEIETCVNDFLSDRDLEIIDKNIEVK